MENKTSLAERLAPLSVPQKIGYIWDYYKGAVLAVAAVLILAAFGIYKLANPGKSNVIEVTAVNVHSAEVKEPNFDRLLRANDYDPDRFQVWFNYAYRVAMADSSERNVTGYQMLYARFLSNDLDLVLSDEAVFASFASQKAYMELEPLLTEAQLETYRDRLIYMEDENGEKHAWGLLLEDTPLQTSGMYEGPVIGAIPYGTKDRDFALALMLELLGA